MNGHSIEDRRFSGACVVFASVRKINNINMFAVPYDVTFGRIIMLYTSAMDAKEGIDDLASRKADTVSATRYRGVSLPVIIPDV